MIKSFVEQQGVGRDFIVVGLDEKEFENIRSGLPLVLDDIDQVVPGCTAAVIVLRADTREDMVQKLKTLYGVELVMHRMAPGLQ